MATKRTPGADVRAALVGAGHRVLADKGVRGLTVRAVAAEAGVAPMGVYNHLDGKDGLLAVIVADGFEQLRATTADAVDSDARRRLRDAGRRYRRFALDNPTLYRLMFSENCDLGGDAGLSALGALTEIVRYAQGAGVIRADDPFELTLAIWSCVHGAVSLELDAAAPIPVDRDAIFESVLDVIEHGVIVR
ncbi:TetR/AcrR family transcriptional regulator [Williamsia sp.]|uniref:TetR/AcrR family transcriptional regulator n=1 Tax=Williamsia sp. TaxID=1872085 RepID=UPI001A30DD37|nr:TetR/AcrR family transcriptional regulator [Williamsia sp.]MBJ7290429.1 TetR/AcrR family transcriptional regulator [Williamsia sp.]